MRRILLITIILTLALLQFPPAMGIGPTTYRVVGSIISVPAGGYGDRTVQCNPGDFATGGGPTTSVTSGPGPVSLQVSDSFPTLSGGVPTGWRVLAYNPTSVSLNLAATVVCTTASTYRAQSTVISVSAGAYMSRDAQCLEGDYATGGGASTSVNLSDEPPALVLSDSFPTLSEGRVSGWRVWAHNPTNTALNLVAFVVCTSAFSVYRLVGSVLSVPAGTYRTAQVPPCNSGDYATGGGPSTSVTSGSGRISLALSDSFANLASGIPDGWRVYAYNPTSVSLNLVSIVVCIGAAAEVGCGQNQTCSVVSNATLSPVVIMQNTLRFNVTGSQGTNGYVNATVPKSQIPNIDRVTVRVNGTSTPFTHTANATHYFLYFTLTFQSGYTIDISLGTIVVSLSPPYLAAIAVTLMLLAQTARIMAKRRSQPSN